MRIETRKETLDDLASLTFDFLPQHITGSELSEQEIRFLLYFVRRDKPLKLVELGVSAGGTSSYILKHMPVGSKLHSVDISNKYYRDPTKDIGYMAKKLCDSAQLCNWHLYHGDIVDCIEQIGSGIEFLMLDTTHALPGEILQFLILLPFLRDNAVVVVHDLHLNFTSKSFFFSNTLLYSSVKSDQKYILGDCISNICAFVIEEQTKLNIIDIFHAIYIPWYYFPYELIDKYSKFIATYYSKECDFYFKNCINMQQKIIHKISKHKLYALPYTYTFYASKYKFPAITISGKVSCDNTKNPLLIYVECDGNPLQVKDFVYSTHLNQYYRYLPIDNSGLFLFTFLLPASQKAMTLTIQKRTSSARCVLVTEPAFLLKEAEDAL
jgi:predicted O-methyltransferase YrrM